MPDTYRMNRLFLELQSADWKLQTQISALDLMAKAYQSGQLTDTAEAGRILGAACDILQDMRAKLDDVGQCVTFTLAG